MICIWKCTINQNTFCHYFYVCVKLQGRLMKTHLWFCGCDLWGWSWSEVPLPYINKRWDKSFLHSSPPPYQPPSLSSNSGQSSGIFGNMRQKCGDKPIICISCNRCRLKKTLLSCVSSACVLPFSTIVFRVLPFSTVGPICVFCFLTRLLALLFCKKSDPCPTCTIVNFILKGV